jgi:LPS-assembly protein
MRSFAVLVAIVGPVAASGADVCAPYTPIPCEVAAVASASTSVAELRASAERLDWVEFAALPPAVAADRPAHCDGAYVEPEFPLPRSVDPGHFPIDAGADAVEYWRGERAELRGNVRATQGNRSLSMDRALYREAGRTIEVEGNLVIREPGLLVLGERAELSLDSGAAEIREARFVFHSNWLRGSAAAVGRDDEGNLSIDRGRVTRCEPGNDSWFIEARRIDIPEGSKFGTARGAVLRAGDLPLFYAPYIRFPVTNERLTGFLFPDLGYNSEDGLDVALPYYLNLAPNYDATLTPRWIAERGVGGEAEFRHLSRVSWTEVGGAYLYDDDQYDGRLSRDDFQSLGLPGDFDPADRWLVWSRHEGDFGRFSSAIDFANVSDDDYFSDLGSDLSVASQIYLPQRGEVRYDAGRLSLRLRGEDFEVLDDETATPYRRLPELAVSYLDGGLGPLSASLAASLAEFDRSNAVLTGIDRITGRRLHVEPRLQLPLRWPSGFLRVTSGFRYTEYDLNDQEEGGRDRPSREVWFASADAGVVFEREARFLGGSALHTLEPRLYYLNQGEASQADLPLFDASDLTFGYSQLFRDNRFTGLDRIGDANQLSLGVTTRFLDSTSGRERLRGSIGQIYYFEDREVTLREAPGQDERRSNSAVAAEGVAALGRNWSVHNDLVWNASDDDWTQVGASVAYRGPARKVFTLGFRRLVDYGLRVRQLDASAYWPVARRLAVFGRWYYDFESDREVEMFGGIEYNDCCWNVRFVGRKFLAAPSSALIDDTRSDSGVFLQVVFKGLAGFGGRIDRLLESGIRGFDPEEF